jgi:hypothetical protein
MVLTSPSQRGPEWLKGRQGGGVDGAGDPEHVGRFLRQ